jgi:inosine/xanthosine triphosphatase
MTIKIILASKNPVKIQATLNGFKQMLSDDEFEITGVSVSSDVNDQPLSDSETLQGAKKRAANAFALKPDADFWVGIEGGIENINEELSVFAWVVIMSKEKSGKGRTAAFILPRQVADLIHQGLELGEADDRIFHRSNSKQENGAVGILTGDVIDRCTLYEPAVILALIPFKNPAFYPSGRNQV